MVGRTGSLSGCQLQVERARDLACDLGLHSEEVDRVPIEPVCPQMRIGSGIDQLGVHTNPVARPPNPTSRIGAVFNFRSVENQWVRPKGLHYGRGWRGWLEAV